jgi:hypothetical protein
MAIFERKQQNYLYTTDATSGAGTTYPSGAPEFTPVLVGFVLAISRN